MLNSVLEHDSGIKPVLVLVEKKQKLNLNTQWEHIWIEDLIPQITELSKRYSGAEMCFIAKPVAFEYLLNQDDSTEVFYFDSDIRLFHDLLPLSKALRGATALLTPHHLFPFEDSIQPKEFDNLRTGVFNLGFCAMRPTLEAKRLCKWWKINTQNFGEEQFDLGLSSDQQWMSLAPVLFSNVKICSHPGANVAFWNLHERNLDFENGLYKVNGQPLLFFHFSNFQQEPEMRLVKEELYPAKQALNSEAIQRLMLNHGQELKSKEITWESKQLKKKLVQSPLERTRENHKQFGFLKKGILLVIHQLPSSLKIRIYQIGLFLVRNIKFK